MYPKEEDEIPSSKAPAAIASPSPDVEIAARHSTEKLSDTEANVAGLIVVVLLAVAGMTVGVPGSSDPHLAGAFVGALIGLALIILSWTWRH